MTTNHIERLDPALIRPGRVDAVHLIGDATAHQIRAMFSKFYMTDYNSSNVSTGQDGLVMKRSSMSTDLSTKLDSFIDVIQNSGRTVSMAQLQGHFMRFKEAPAEAIANVADLLATAQVITTATHPGEIVHSSEESVSSVSTPRGRGWRQLSVAEVDRMVFNPQPGWDSGLKSL